jgi:hypothetical protein
VPFEIFSSVEGFVVCYAPLATGVVADVVT